MSEALGVLDELQASGVSRELPVFLHLANALSAHGCRVDKCDQPPPLSLAPAYWSLPPSLHGPKETGPGDTRLLRAYESLQRGLQEAGLPETVDRTNETRLGCL
ncbi:unnamed protein product [Lampetra fluviatilis]